MRKILIGITIIMATSLFGCSPQVAPTRQVPTVAAVPQTSAPAATPQVPTATVVPQIPTRPATLSVPAPTVVPQTNATPTAVEIGDNDKGKTVAASVGAHIRIVLHSTYWQFDDNASPIIKPLGAPVVTPDMTVRIPGTGAGTVTVEFQAIAPGQVSVRASRVTCGEALLCAEDQRVFQVTINIK
jgi:hypothetical protein